MEESKDQDFLDWKRVRTAIEEENTLINYRLTWLFSSQAFLVTSYTLAFIQSGKATDNLPQISYLYSVLLFIISVFGIVLCIYVYTTLTAAINQLNKLDNWWYCRELDEKQKKIADKIDNLEDNQSNLELLGNFFKLRRLKRELKESLKPLRAANKKELDKKHPPLRGKRRFGFEGIINTESIPFIFIFAWIGLILISGVFRIDQVLHIVSALSDFISIKYFLILNIIFLLLNLCWSIYNWSGFNRSKTPTEETSEEDIKI